MSWKISLSGSLDEIRGVLLDDALVRLFDLREVDLVRRELLLPVVVDERVLHDLEEPRLEVRTFFELVVVLVRLEVRLLDEVLRVFGVPRHSVGGVVQGVDVGHCCLFEIPALLVCMDFRGLHDLSRTPTAKTSTFVPHAPLDARANKLVTPCSTPIPKSYQHSGLRDSAAAVTGPPGIATSKSHPSSLPDTSVHESGSSQ